jgi:hypothetical protein
MICGEKMEAVGKKILGTMGETVVGFACDDASVQQIGHVAVEGYLSQTDNDANTRESLNFIGQMDSAVANLLGLGFVAGWGTADDGGDPGVAEFEAIVTGDCTGFASESEFVENWIHKVA